MLQKVNNQNAIQIIPECKKVVSDSPRLVDFAVGLRTSVLMLPNGQVGK